MDTYYQKKSDILAGLNIVQRFFRGKSMDAMEKLMNSHPMLRMFFDSELSSPIEDKVLQSMATAFASLLKVIPEKHEAIGVAIAHNINDVMYSAKILHHLNTNRISFDTFRDLMSEHIAVEYTVAIQSLWSAIGEGITKATSFSIRGILSFFQVDPSIQEYAVSSFESMMAVVTQYVSSRITEEKAKEIIKNILTAIADSAKQVSELLSDAIETIKDLYSDTREWVREKKEDITNAVYDIIYKLKSLGKDKKEKGKLSEREDEYETEEEEEEEEDIQK